jgi:hypothetical protein
MVDGLLFRLRHVHGQARVRRPRVLVRRVLRVAVQSDVAPSGLGMENKGQRKGRICALRCRGICSQ